MVYQIYPRSFCDRSGDGIGDLEGIRAHLDHLVWLGVDAVWLSPIFPSPMADFGYDVADYCGVDPLFGSPSDLDALIEATHEAGLRFLLDWVPNHTSDRHPWFEASRSSPTSPYRDWYHWRDSADGPPNNWRAAFTGIGRSEFPPAWTFDDSTGQWYLHQFLPEQPDLNWANPAVRSAMHETLRYWLDRGVDGFRMDVIHALGKDPAYPDLPAEHAAIPICAMIDDPSTHDYVREIRTVVKSARADAVIIGETVPPSVGQIAGYYGTDEYPELDLAFNFHPLHTRWEPGRWRRQIDQVMTEIAPVGWPAWALGNHDNGRQRTRYGSEARARAAAVLLLTLMGTAFVYAGEELGLADAVVTRDRQVDPGGRDGCRAPIPWEPTGRHGWAADPWLPWPPESSDGRDKVTMGAEPGSTLNLYRRLLAVRRASPALATGTFEWLPMADPVLGYRRACAQDDRVVLINFSEVPAKVELPPGSWSVEIGTHTTDTGSPDRSAALTLAGDEAVVLKPAP